MTAWPWNNLDRIDGGSPRGSQGSATKARGLRTKEPNAAGVVVPRSTPDWMKRDIADVTETMEAQVQCHQDPVDFRNSFDQKYDIRDIDGQRVAHMTPRLFQDSIPSGKFRILEKNVARIVISDGERMHVELEFESIYMPRDVLAAISIRDLQRHGIAGALEGNSSAQILDGQSKPIGYMRVTGMASELRAHGNVSSQGLSVVHHSTAGLHRGNVTEVFKSASNLSRLIAESPQGIEIFTNHLKTTYKTDVRLGRVLPYSKNNPTELYSHHSTLKNFRDTWIMKFMMAARPSSNNPIEEVNGIVLYPFNYSWDNRSAEKWPMDKAIAVFIPADYQAPVHSPLI